MLTTAPVDCLIRGRNCMNTSGSGVGRPSFGSRACRCRIAAPASAAAIASRAISSGVSGRCGLIVGVWIDPVTAQVMTTLPRSGILFLPSADDHDYPIMAEFGPEVVRLFAGGSPRSSLLQPKIDSIIPVCCLDHEFGPAAE